MNTGKGKGEVEPIDTTEAWGTPPFDPEHLRWVLWVPGEMLMIGSEGGVSQRP